MTLHVDVPALPSPLAKGGGARDRQPGRFVVGAGAVENVLLKVWALCHREQGKPQLLGKRGGEEREPGLVFPELPFLHETNVLFTDVESVFSMNLSLVPLN